MDKIIVKKARVHNLKNIDVEIPRDKLVVITGLSGSGKSSLAFDTIYAEGQRRYVESLSAYARQFLGMMDKPDVDHIEGLSPAISIDQKSVSRNPRSTVGTITEVYDYLRLLYARAGVPFDPDTGQEVKAQDPRQMVDKIMELQGKPILILAPVTKDKKGEHKGTLTKAFQDGFMRVRVDEIIYLIDEALQLELDKQKKHNIELVIDRLLDESGFNRARVLDSVETALRMGGGQMIVSEIVDKNKSIFKDMLLSERYVFADESISFGELEPKNFSFNSPHGACEKCDGLGEIQEISPDLVIPNKKLTIKEGAIKPWTSFSRQQGAGTWYMKVLEAAAASRGIDLNVPVVRMKKEDLDYILYGDTKVQGGDKVPLETDTYKINAHFIGVIPSLLKRYFETDSEFVKTEIEKYMTMVVCPVCGGKRLKRQFLFVKVAGKTIDEIVNMSIDEAVEYFKKTDQDKKLFDERGLRVAKPIYKEIIARLVFLLNVGLNYLTLDRPGNTLSGGEAQRIRLATQIGSGLVGVLYILDEPSIGLHQRDNSKLIKTLEDLRDVGNSVIVVEHDEEMIRTADYVLDIGPGAGNAGGCVVAAGTPKEIEASDGLTGQYLSGQKVIASPKKYRKGSGKFIRIKGAAEHNLKNIDVEIPLGKFVVVSGVSGSGKSTLIQDILCPVLSKKLYRAKGEPGKHKDILGIQNVNKLVSVDQSPIGRTPRSNPATYTGIFTYIRDLFAQTKEAQARGYKAGRFSFNVKGGRCETCKGEGVLKIEMNFLPDVYVECGDCHGKRYNKEALEITYRDKTIAEILDMEVEQALEFFKNIPALKDKLLTLFDVGLGYMKLGQPATELSGGEAQRIKLATELSRRASGKTLYILDEPTTGLHFEDVRKLLQVLHRLADKGNTVLVIEHNLDVIKSADWLIDLGPEGGARGGELVAVGTPKEVAKNKKSYTGHYLAKMKL
jgi:excinuclease ABC subunit A